MTCKTNTYWTASADGDLMYIGSGQEYWSQFILHSQEFPIKSADKVAHLLNEAFGLGMVAKAEQIRHSLGIK